VRLPLGVQYEEPKTHSHRPRACSDSRVFDFLMLMRNFSCCGARCIVRALAMLSAWCSCAEPKKAH